MLLSNAKVSVRYAAKALSGFQTPKLQSATRQRQYAAFKCRSFSPLRGKGSMLLSNAEASVRCEAGCACYLS